LAAQNSLQQARRIYDVVIRTTLLGQQKRNQAVYQLSLSLWIADVARFA
jgi:hypothetical protein